MANINVIEKIVNESILSNASSLLYKHVGEKLLQKPGIKWRWDMLHALAHATHSIFNYLVPYEGHVLILMSLGVMGKRTWDRYQMLYHSFRECNLKYPPHIDAVKNKRCKEQYSIQMAAIFKAYKNKCHEIEHKRERKKCMRVIDRSILFWEKQVTKYARY